jgi:hypothetical protein
MVTYGAKAFMPGYPDPAAFTAVEILLQQTVVKASGSSKKKKSHQRTIEVLAHGNQTWSRRYRGRKWMQRVGIAGQRHLMIWLGKAETPNSNRTYCITKPKMVKRRKEIHLFSLMNTFLHLAMSKSI